MVSVTDRPVNLEKATYNIASKFKIGGILMAKPVKYQLHVALLVSYNSTKTVYLSLIYCNQCHYVIKNRVAVAQAAKADTQADTSNSTKEIIDLESDKEEDADAQNKVGSSRSKKRKRVDGIAVATATVDKVPKGQDFWSRVNKWLAKLFQINGSKSMKTAKWQRCALSLSSWDMLLIIYVISAICLRPS